MNRSVLSVRCAASARETYPRSTPAGYAVSANPIAATDEKLFVGQRSGVNPVFGSLRSQNQLKVRRSRVSRNACSRTGSCEKAIGSLDAEPGSPVRSTGAATWLLVAHAPTVNIAPKKQRLS